MSDFAIDFVSMWSVLLVAAWRLSDAGAKVGGGAGRLAAAGRRRRKK